MSSYPVALPGNYRSPGDAQVHVGQTVGDLEVLLGICPHVLIAAQMNDVGMELQTFNSLLLCFRLHAQSRHRCHYLLVKLVVKCSCFKPCSRMWQQHVRMEHEANHQIASDNMTLGAGPTQHVQELVSLFVSWSCL